MSTVIGYVSCLVVVLTGGRVMAQDYYSFSSDFYGQRAAAKMEFAPSPERLHREMKYLEMRMRFPTFTLWDAKRWKQFKFEQETEIYRRVYQRLMDLTLPHEEYKRKYHPDDE